LKRFIQITLILSLLLFSTGLTSANSGITVNIDGTPVSFTHATGLPFIDANNRTQVPFRIVLESFGATVEWNAAGRVAIAEKDGVTVRVPIGTHFVYRNGEQFINDTSSLVRDGRTYLPIRLVLESFGAEVNWDAATRTVLVTSPSQDDSN